MDEQKTIEAELVDLRMEIRKLKQRISQLELGQEPRYDTKWRPPYKVTCDSDSHNLKAVLSERDANYMLRFLDETRNHDE